MTSADQADNGSYGAGMTVLTASIVIGLALTCAPDVDPAIVEPGHDVKLTHYWKLVASPGDGWNPPARC